MSPRQWIKICKFIFTVFPEEKKKEKQTRMPKRKEVEKKRTKNFFGVFGVFGAGENQDARIDIVKCQDSVFFIFSQLNLVCFVCSVFKEIPELRQKKEEKLRSRLETGLFN